MRVLKPEELKAIVYVIHAPPLKSIENSKISQYGQLRNMNSTKREVQVILLSVFG